MHGPIEDVYRRIRRNRQIEIKFMDRMDVGLSIVRSMPETRDVRVEDHRATIELEGDDAKVAELLDALTQQGVRLRSFHDKDPTLEDVFMLVTKGLVT
jgi:ABC-2 type transport system ATP-binding protein